MCRSLKALAMAAVLAATTTSAMASTCGAKIEQLQSAARQAAATPVAGPTAPQTIGAQLGHQPTAKSVKQAERRAQSGFAAMLAHAKALDAQGKNAECLQAVGAASRMLELN